MIEYCEYEDDCLFATSLKVRVKACLDLAYALLFMHKNGIAHRNLSHTTIYISQSADDDGFTAKLGGLTRAKYNLEILDELSSSYTMPEESLD